MGVVVSIFPLVDFVENVGKEKVDVSVMVPPGASPHAYEPSPSQMAALARAMVAVLTSGELEDRVRGLEDRIGGNHK